MARQMAWISAVAFWLMAGVFGASCLADSPAAAQSWALEFDGVDDYVNLGNNSNLRLSGDMAVCAWCKMAEGTSGWDMGIAGKMVWHGGVSYSGFALFRWIDNGFWFWIGPGTGCTGIGTDEHYTDSEWHHVVGMIRNGDAYLYLDGALAEDYPQVRNIRDSGQYAFVGKECSNVDEWYFKGLIDEVRFYDRGLTSQEVATVMSGGLRTDADLVGLWDMELWEGQQPSEQIVHDRSGRAGNAFLGATSAVEAADPKRTSLGKAPCCLLTFNTDAEYRRYVTTNDAEHPRCPGNLVERIVGQQPDPKGMLKMKNLRDPGQFNDVISAKAAVLLPCDEPATNWEIRFSYKFLSTSGCLRILFCGGAYTPSVAAPDATAAGGAYSSTWGQYSGSVTFSPPAGKPPFVEFELSGPEGTSLLVDDLSITPLGRSVSLKTLDSVPVVRCVSHCGDIAGLYEGWVGPEDFVAATLSCGARIPPPTPAQDLRCLDQTFTCDNVASMEDAMYWDWLQSLRALRQCGTITGFQALSEIGPAGLSIVGGCQINAPLLIAGKRYLYDPYNVTRDFLKDGLFGLNTDGRVVPGPCTWGTDRLCGRLAKDVAGQVYQLHVTEGIVRIADGRRMLRPTSLSYGGGSVDIGWSQQTGAPPIQDVAFDSEGNAYVVPVVVKPRSGSPYRAAACVRLTGGTSIERVYAPSLHPTGAYEIELDRQGTVYILDRQESSLESRGRLLRFSRTGQPMPELDLGPVVTGRLPTAFHVSAVDGSVVIAAGSSLVFLDSTLAKTNGITIYGVDYITSIAQEPGTRAIWVAGFETPVRPARDDVLDGRTLQFEPYYRPVVARVPWGSTGSVDAVCVCDYTSGEGDYLSLPWSMVWIGK